MQLFPPGEGVRRVSLVRLSGEIARALAGVGRVAVEGEVHHPKRTAADRIWFTLRDRAAQITVVCPPARGGRRRVVAGERVLVTGCLTYANERGSLQLVADEVAPVGEGAIAAAIAEARGRLAADGLLDRPRRAIPRLPARIGVVCGAEAAVRADIESVVAARFPGYPLAVTEVNVSGPGAADAVLRALKALDTRADVEVIVLARGGGDAAQLLPFSDEELCRAMASCATPVVSAIGHDGDRPLCDEVADLRCGTPSLAAAAVVPDRVRLETEVTGLQEAAARMLAVRVDSAARRVAGLDRRRAVADGLARAGERLERARLRHELLSPDRRVEQAAIALGRLDWRAPARRRFERADALLAAHRGRLDALDPARVLERGYAIVRAPDGRVVRRASQVAAGTAIGVQVSEGWLGARVERIEEAQGAGRAGR